MSPSSRSLAVFVVLSMVSVGCATARVVSIQPRKGGVITVNPPHDSDAREKATLLMADNCGSGGYDITEEGEAVVGSVSNGSVQKTTGIFGQPAMAQNSSTTNQTEWRITYKCKSGSARM